MYILTAKIVIKSFEKASKVANYKEKFGMNAVILKK